MDKAKGDLISREALLKMVRRYEEYDEGGWSLTVKAVPVEAIEDAPAVEAVPVVHGRWIDRGDYVTTAYGSLDIKVCSNCNAEVTIDQYDDYCPNCNAKMDGKEVKAW